MGSWELAPGVNNVGSYQVSGRPYATGSVLVHISGSSALRVTFPTVTKWVQIIPHEGTLNNVRVAFSERGMHAGNYFHVAALNPSGSTPLPVDVKVSEIWLMSTDSAVATVDVLAGLTNIAHRSVAVTDPTSTSVGGPSWSGSLGVG